MLSRNNKFGVANTVSADSVTISSEGKRQAIVDKVAANIVDRIITEGPKEENEAQITEQIERELGKKINFSKDKTQFTYTTIDDDNNKTTKTLSVEDSQFVVKRMTELARQVADNNMEA